MNCSNCGKPLVAKYEGVVSTLIGYCGFSFPHNHDDNCTSMYFVCADLHENKLSVINKCSHCDWVGKKTCPCSTKVEQWPDLPILPRIKS